MTVVDDRTRKIAPPEDGGEEGTGTRKLAMPAGPVTAGPPAMPLGRLAPGHVLCGDCTVEQTIRPHESQQPGIYRCVAPEGDVIVKVAPAAHPPRSDVWEKLPELVHPNVLRTYRTTEEGGFFFEVQEYCNGGTLADRLTRGDKSFTTVTADWVLTQFVPQAHSGLEYLHARDIVHRDVKPSNIYCQRTAGGGEILVLGDFDISAVLDRTHTSRDTQRVAGTWYYTAPEAFPRFVDERGATRSTRVTRMADYYSLGVTIVELLQGTTCLHMCELPDLFDFYLQGSVVAIPENIPERLSLLLRGLLIRDRRARWGAEEVGRWLRGEVSAGDRRRINEDAAYVLPRVSHPYRLKEHSPVDLPGLADAMYREPEAATEDLMSGDILLSWIGAIDANKAREIRSVRERLRQKPDLALLAAIMVCDPFRPYIFGDGQEVRSAGEWLDHMGLLPAGEAASEDRLSRLATWLRFKWEPDERLAEGVEGIIASPPAVRLEELSYLVDPARPYSIAPGLEAATPEAVARAAYGNPEDWSRTIPDCYNASFRRWQEGYLHAWMRQRGLGSLAEQAAEVEEGLSEHPFAAFEAVLRLLCPELPPVQVELDLARVRGGLRVPYGQSRTVTLPYATTGCGVPFGGLEIEDGQPGISLSDQLIRSRSGAARLTLDSRGGLPVSRSFRARIRLTSGYAVLAGGGVSITYGVRLPAALTLGRIGLGLLLGGIIFGLPRWIISELGITVAPQPAYDAEWLWEAIRAGEWPYLYFIGSAAMIGGACYAGWRVWLWAMSKSES